MKKILESSSPFSFFINQLFLASVPLPTWLAVLAQHPTPQLLPRCGSRKCIRAGTDAEDWDRISTTHLRKFP